MNLKQNENNQKNNSFADSKELKIEILKEGQGEGVKNGNSVEVHYTGMLLDGTVFDSSVPRGETFEFNVGAGWVIQGWELGILDMKLGEVRRLTIPSSMGYGDKSLPMIPAGSTLVFDIELISIG